MATLTVPYGTVWCISMLVKGLALALLLTGGLALVGLGRGGTLTADGLALVIRLSVVKLLLVLLRVLCTALGLGLL